MRYINKLVLEERDVEVTDYLKLYPKLPEGFPGLEDFHCEVLFPGDLDEEQLRVIVMSGRESESNANSLLIDLIYTGFVQQNEEITSILNRAHKAIGTLFEKLITDKSRSIFKETEI